LLPALPGLPFLRSGVPSFFSRGVLVTVSAAGFLSIITSSVLFYIDGGQRSQVGLSGRDGLRQVVPASIVL
jgi:hypothetical protein